MEIEAFIFKYKTTETVSCVECTLYNNHIQQLIIIQMCI